MALNLVKFSNNLAKKYEITDPKRKELLQFMMLPKAMRPRPDLICGRLGIEKHTYYNWLREPAMNLARREMIKQFYQDDIPDVIMAMKYEALAGNERAARLFLEYVDDFKKEEEKDKPFTPPNTLPAQEINIIINNLEQKFYGNDQPREDQRTVIEAGSDL